MEPSTPGLLFPAISLLMLAYTNRFFALANLMRTMIARYEKGESPSVYRQIINLKTRIYLLRYTQTLGVSSLVCCSFSLFFIFFSLNAFAKISFVLAVILMIISLFTSLWEIHLSVRSLDIEISKIKINH
ncbi:MAG: DUF2721 domain-containing protein [Leptospira sp.]|nr:DUF2721 domain-containing protein [Leptospira sp.]